MKRALLILAALALVACTGAAVPSPATVEWDAPTEGFADSYEVAVERLGVETIIGAPVATEFVVDLEALDVYGKYVVKVRSVAETDGEFDYSEWIRSDTDADVITVDGVAQTFVVTRLRPAGLPSMLRIQ